MKIYHLFHFDRSLKVRWLINEINQKKEVINYKVIQLDATRGEHLKAPFNELNPYSLIPTVEFENGETMFEAGAICNYLSQQFAPELIDMQDKEYNQWLFYFSSSFDQICGGLIGLKMFGDDLSIRNKLESKLKNKLPVMEQHLADKDYWYQDKFSLLDIFAWQNLAFLANDNQLSSFKHLQRYIDNIAKRPALAVFNPDKLINPT
ncbi:glutathione S-transferase family protein [Algibacillus agarilyticus]|uniref:glutathione S-transferase family protein n=1 Tax=Algibacillus agarilyticus TaxID=2234133 RepID=UPI000DD02A08|nr:glutathione S-transferase family protein [Algibacillus agarilyticus]